MNTLAKVLLGTTIAAAAGAVVVAVAIKKNEQPKDIAEAAKQNDEHGSVLKRIKRFVTKKVVKFLAWVALHMEQIEAVSVVVGLASGAISIAGAIRDYKAGSDLEMKIDKLQEAIDETNVATNHNNLVFGIGLDHICDKVGVDTDDLKKDLDAVDQLYPCKKKLIA